MSVRREGEMRCNGRDHNYSFTFPSRCTETVETQLNSVYLQYRQYIKTNKLFPGAKLLLTTHPVFRQVTHVHLENRARKGKKLKTQKRFKGRNFPKI